MSDYIHVEVLSLKELFSGSYRFRLPWFQRAYAWKSDHVGKLLTDLFDVMEQDGPARRYFLGTLMIARPPGNLDTALVDGHQRVMTLTLLFAVMRDLEPDPVKRTEIQNLIGTSANRLQPQDNLEEFCRKYVQAMGATEVDPDGETDSLSEAEDCIIENRDHIKRELSDEETTLETRRQLLDTIINHCFVSVHEVTDEDEAWRILQIEEDTRHHFNDTNRAKVSLLSMVPVADREACRRIWEDCESLLDADDLNGLLGHLKAIKIRDKKKKTSETDIAQAYCINTNGIGFMRDVVKPAAEHFSALMTRNVGNDKDRPQISAALERLHWLDESYWQPAALHWLEKRPNDPETVLFFKRLDRLSWLLRIGISDAGRRERKIVLLLGEIDRGKSIYEMREFDISKKLMTDTLEMLRGKNFDQRHYATRILRRLSADLGQDPGPVSEKLVTVEHILPKSFVEGSPWRRNFRTENSVKEHAHRLGNLTFLNGRQNNTADNREWSAKQEIFKQSEFLMTQQLALMPDWTRETVNRRTEDLIALLFKNWDITVEPIIQRSLTPRLT